jgi:hypothetical protein
VYKIFLTPIYQQENNNTDIPTENWRFNCEKQQSHGIKRKNSTKNVLLMILITFFRKHILKYSVICYSNLKHFKNTTCDVNDLKTEATYSLKRACQDITWFYFTSRETLKWISDQKTLLVSKTFEVYLMLNNFIFWADNFDFLNDDLTKLSFSSFCTSLFSYRLLELPIETITNYEYSECYKERLAQYQDTVHVRRFSNVTSRIKFIVFVLNCFVLCVTESLWYFPRFFEGKLNEI